MDPLKDRIAMYAQESTELDKLTSMMNEMVTSIRIENNGNVGEFIIDAFSEIVRTTIQNVVIAGQDIEAPVKGITIGLMKVFGDLGEDALQVLNYMSAFIVEETAECKGDVVLAAQAIVEGVWESVYDLDVDINKAMLEASAASVMAAYEINFDMGDEVRDALGKTLNELR